MIRQALHSMGCAVTADLRRYEREQDAAWAEEDAYNAWLENHSWSELLDTEAMEKVISAVDNGTEFHGYRHLSPNALLKELLQEAWEKELENRMDCGEDDYGPEDL